MSFVFDQRPSDSPLVDLVWRTQSERAGSFISTAVIHSEMVVTKYHGHLSLTVRGPETKATEALIPPDAEFFGIQFKLGTFMPHLPAINLVDASAIFPEALGGANAGPDPQNQSAELAVVFVQDTICLPRYDKPNQTSQVIDHEQILGDNKTYEKANC